MQTASASSLEKALASGQPVITAEITPPVGGDPSHALEMAEGLRGQVQAFNVTDGSRAVNGMRSLALCRLLLMPITARLPSVTLKAWTWPRRPSAISSA